MYRLTASAAMIQRIADGAFIPVDSRNPDYRAYLAWVQGGNTAAPYVAPSLTVGRVPCSPVYARRHILTQPELVALHTLALTNVQMAIWMFDMSAATYLLPADPELQQGLDGLVALNILTPQRKADILAALTLGMPANFGEPQ